MTPVTNITGCTISQIMPESYQNCTNFVARMQHTGSTLNAYLLLRPADFDINAPVGL